MKRVLAIDPITRGFGYAVLEGPHALLDWGLKGTSRWPEPRERWCLREITELVETYGPDRIIVEDCLKSRSRLGLRNQHLLKQVIQLADEFGIPTSRITRTAMRSVFVPAGASTKYQIARAIAERFPELGWRMPRLRKPWMSEDARMGIFDALAFALAFYARHQSKGNSAVVTVSALKGGDTAPSIMRRT